MTGRKPNVLILDDDLLTLELYSRELGNDYQVVTSNSVQETRQSMQVQALDIVIMEPAVNGDEGWELLQEIHLSKNPPAVIICSVEDERRVGLAQRVNLYLVKPVLPNTLHTLVDQVMAKRLIQST